VLPECWSFGAFVGCLINFQSVFIVLANVTVDGAAYDVRLPPVSGARLPARVLCHPIFIALPECWSFGAFVAC
jgi:hypothetical protein